MLSKIVFFIKMDIPSISVYGFDKKSFGLTAQVAEHSQGK